MRLYRLILPACAFALFIGVSTISFAVPYASSVRNTMDSTWEFVLNEAADSVTVLRDGGNPFNIATPAAGRHTFPMAGFTTFSIEVSKSAAEGWTELSQSSNLFADFERPTGLAVNSIPSSPYFGTVYVNNASTLTTATGRTMGDGVYALTADLMGVDLASFAKVTNANDTSQAKAPGWTVAGSNSSAWRLALDDSGNVIVTDWSDANGGVKYATANLTMGGLILNEEEGPTGGVDSSVSDEFGPIPLHGSIVSKPIVTGTVGVDLTLWGMDEDLDSDLEVPGNDGNSIWRWDVGNATNYTINPTLVIDAGSIPNTPQGRDNFLALNIGVIAEAHFEPQFDKWYLTQPRDNGNEAGLIVLTAGDDGASTVEWSSLQFSEENGLDGFTDTGGGALSVGIQDVFREAYAMQFSNDGTELYLMMSSQYGSPTNNNPVVGPNSPNLPGHVLVIPLDEDGLPDVEVDDNGTPGDTTDDFLANVESIDIGADGNLDRANIDLDAAGNVYLSSNITERLQVFSPGGSWTAITNSNGTFSLVPFGIPPGTAGDYNNDAVVDAADYVVWRKLLGTNTQLQNEGDGVTPGMVTDEDYTTWRTNFGSVTPPGAGSSVAAVPEPSAILLAMLGLAMLGARRVR